MVCSILCLVLLGEHLVGLLDFSDLVTKLLDKLLLCNDFLLELRVKLLRIVLIWHQAPTRGDRSALLRLLNVLKHFLTLCVLLEDLIQLF